MASLSQAEIWDDSTLVDSWNDALQEYDRYHSMHARGERVEDVLKTHDAEEEDPSAGFTEEQSEVNGQVLEENELSMDAQVEGEPSIQNPPSNKEAKTATPLPTAPVLPQHLIGQVHDEGLKNLLMSWYYAGYYTGLYEGQQAAKKD